ncbi:hypothetical protein [Nitrosomonas sp.]|uniref:hypothetical protein n=1 Tax=Nitrosomonas sp. TaxID=42353 RepID=UPI0032EAF8CA
MQYGLKREAKRYNKSYLGELVHFDTKRFSLLKGQFASEPREYLFVAIDDFPGSCMLRSFLIKPNTAPRRAACFLLSTAAQCPYQIDYAYSDNGQEFKGTDAHAVVKACRHRVSGRSLPALIALKPTTKRTSHPY